MNKFDSNLWPFWRYNPWDDGDSILSLSEGIALSAACFFPEDGIPERDCNKYFDYRLDLMLEAELAVRGLLGFLVDFHQREKLTRFLLCFCDHLEITYRKNAGELEACSFQINFSDQIALCYSSRMCGCIVALDGKQDSFHSISPCAIDDLRHILEEIWGTIREFPLWEIKAENDQYVTIQRKVHIL